MNIAICQFKINTLEILDNTKRIIDSIKKAKQNNADIIIFPELSTIGSFINDILESRSFVEEIDEYNKKIIEESNGIYVIFGTVAIDKDNIGADGRIRKYNSIFVAKDGKLVKQKHTDFIIKNNLLNYNEYNENRHFFSLKDLAYENNKTIKEYYNTIELDINSKKYNVAISFYSDIISKNSILNYTENNIDLIITIANNKYSIGNNNIINENLSNTSKKHNSNIIYVNNTGIQSSSKNIYVFDGLSSAYNKKGELIFEANRYEENLYFIDLEIDNNTISSLYKNENTYKSIYESIKYGIRNFMRTIGAEKVVIGVSGGIDSALSSAIYVDSIGADNVLLVNMPSKYNSNTTKNLAKTLADNLNCAYMIVPIQESVDFSINQFQSIPMIKNGKESFLTITQFMTENIQARDRSSRILAGISAGFNAVFTCNANKTETFVGYCTMYGDNAGFFAALADLWKYQIYGLAKYMNEEVFKKEVIPQGTIDIIPSAELSTNQAVDEGKGDPIKYNYHDYLFKAFTEVFNRVMPEDILKWYIDGSLEENIGCEKGIIKKYFNTHLEFIEDLEKWYKQHLISVYKRVQSPPILSLTNRTFGGAIKEVQNLISFSDKYIRLKKSIMS